MTQRSPSATGETLVFRSYSLPRMRALEVPAWGRGRGPVSSFARSFSLVVTRATQGTGSRQRSRSFPSIRAWTTPVSDRGLSRSSEAPEKMASLMIVLVRCDARLRMPTAWLGVAASAASCIASQIAIESTPRSVWL